MRIICVEEHTMDAAIAKASRAALAEQAPYMSALGSGFQDESGSAADMRPRMLGSRQVMESVDKPIADRLPDMDAGGIDMQVLSYSNVTQYVSVDQAADLARAANDRLAEAVAANPGRFGAFSTLPWQDPDAAVAEAERTVKQLGFKGTLLVGHPGDTFLDDERYDGVLAKLAELGVPLYVHPGNPLRQVQMPYYGGLSKDLSARFSLFGWGWHNEAGIQVIRMILAGVLDKHPKLQIISGHWGEMVPFYLQRMDDAMPQGATGLSRTISQTYKDQVFVTPSGMLTMPHFKFIHEVLGAERILFSVDYPYLTLSGAKTFLETLPISEAEKAMIAHGNAERLLKL